MKLRTLCAAATLIALPAVVMAQPIKGPYVSLGGGLNLEDQTTTTFSFEQFNVAPPSPWANVGLPGPFAINLKRGYAFSGAVGYGLGNGIRFELEGSYRSNPLNNSSALGRLLIYNGNDQKTSAILSINYDVDIGLPIFPYVGAGAGVAWNTWSHVTRTGNQNVFTFGAPGNLGQVTETGMTGVNAINGTQAVLALQFTAGASYPIPSVPGLSLTLDYKYFAMPNYRSFPDVLTFSCPQGGCNTVGLARLPASGPGYGTYGAEYNHSIMIGIRYAFGGRTEKPAPAVPVPVVVAAEARTYLVFFDWDKATLTDRARQIVADAAKNSAKVQVTRIEVNGNADTSGAPAYNNGLAMRRAQSVAAELVKDGVKKEQIAIKSFGDTHLLVPTGPGVREPQNRRVEIVLK